MKAIRNIGIFAHVDAGKTTLSEQILVHSGSVKQAGRVDNGTAHTDNLPVEQRRGISVKATCVAVHWQNTLINLIDTPGHMDFSAEVERSFWALDGAVLIIDAAEGVQPQTEVLFRALRQQRLPFLIFLNKTDRPNADIPETLKAIRKHLADDVVPLWEPDTVTEFICGTDDQLMEAWLSGQDIPMAEIREHLIRLSSSGQIHPVMKGSALNDEGVTGLLDAVVELLPAPTDSTDLCGVAFAAANDRIMGRGLWIRLFGGCLKNREALDFPGEPDPVSGEERIVQKKITQIRTVSGEDAGMLSAGEVGIVYGLGDTPIGHVFGNRELLPRRIEPGLFRTPLITVQVLPEKPEQMQALREACTVLSSEDPLLNAEYIRTTNELHLRVMGKIQLEILTELLKNRFDLTVAFGDPTVIYRETIARKATGFVAYTMPKPCWAIMEFDLEPGPRGSGVTFSSVVPIKDILPRYQHQVEQALPLALKQGRLGWQVTDLKITLTGGNHHQFHTHPLDFIVATPMGIQDGLQQAGSVLLEPILECRLLIPADCVGKVMSDIHLMRGEVTETVSDEDRVSMIALLPVRTSMDYPTVLASVTGGRGSMSTSLHGYRECPVELGSTAPRTGTDPLDTARYILAARSALDGGIFDF